MSQAYAERTCFVCVCELMRQSVYECCVCVAVCNIQLEGVQRVRSAEVTGLVTSKGVWTICGIEHRNQLQRIWYALYE